MPSPLGSLLSLHRHPANHVVRSAFGDSLRNCSRLVTGFAVDDEEYQFLEELLSDVTTPQWALIHFEVPMTAPVELSLIGARLGGESDVQQCRMAVHGKILQTMDPAQREQLKIYKARLLPSTIQIAESVRLQLKRRHGVIKTVMDDGRTAICSGMFKKETDFSFFIGLAVVDPSLLLAVFSHHQNCAKVVSENGDQGKLLRPHGGDGDFLVRFQKPLSQKTDEYTNITLFSRKHIHP